MLKNPIRPPPKINKVGLIFVFISKNKERADKRIVIGSTNAFLPSCHVTAAINPIETAFTPSNRPESNLEFLIFGINGFDMATSTNDGRNIPTVAKIAPGIPARI